MIKLYLLLSLVLTGFYQLQFDKINGQIVPTSTFSGKKVLLVNIATSSSRIGQLADLQHLHQLYGDSVVVVAFPSNSFGKENRNDAEIAEFCQSQYGATFTIAKKNSVFGSDAQSVFRWLADSSTNGAMNGIVHNDFYKFLIDNQGMIVGVFGPGVEPMDSLIQNAILGH